MPRFQTFDTTIFNPELGVAADAFVMPKAALEAIPGGVVDISEALGVELGVPVLSPDQWAAVFFAAMVGRVAAFDDQSFDRWQQQMRPDDPRVVFARALVFDDLIPLENSPLTKDSLASLSVRGSAWVVAGSQVWTDHPVRALGVVLVGEFGAVVVGIARAFGDSAAIAVKYHTRRLFHIPTDWVPPEDRH
jgi:hypothetical protein